MSKRLLDEWIEDLLLEKAGQDDPLRRGQGRKYFEAWEQAFKASSDPEIMNVRLQRAPPTDKNKTPAPAVEPGRGVARLVINLDPNQWKKAKI